MFTEICKGNPLGDSQGFLILVGHCECRKTVITTTMQTNSTVNEIILTSTVIHSTWLSKQALALFHSWLIMTEKVNFIVVSHHTWGKAVCMHAKVLLFTNYIYLPLLVVCKLFASCTTCALHRWGLLVNLCAMWITIRKGEHITRLVLQTNWTEQRLGWFKLRLLK